MPLNCRTGGMYRVGQNRIYTPYMTVYLVISLSKLPCVYTECMWFWPILGMHGGHTLLGSVISTWCQSSIIIGQASIALTLFPATTHCIRSCAAAAAAAALAAAAPMNQDATHLDQAVVPSCHDVLPARGMLIVR